MAALQARCPGGPTASLAGPQAIRSARGVSFHGGSRLPQAPPRSSRQPQRALCTVVRAERDSSGGFFAGLVVGGAIFGALGYLFAPQISKALLSDDQRLRLPRFLEEEKKSPEATKQDLAEKIEQLNAAIDEVSSKIGAQDLEEQPTTTPA